MRNSNMQNCNMPGCSMSEPRMSEPRMPEPCMMERCDDFPIGMAYVPWQVFREIYEPDKALDAGTIFMELDKPFLGRRAFRR